MGAVKRQLAYFVTVADENGEPKTFGPSDTVPAWAAKKITNPSAWADGEADDEDDDDGDQGDTGADSGPDYDAMLKADLESEVAKRNEGRDEDDLIEVEGNGNKPDLVAALQADDAAQAEQA